MIPELTALAESLDSAATAKIVDPYIDVIAGLLSKRFEHQAAVAMDGGALRTAADIKLAKKLDTLLDEIADAGEELAATWLEFEPPTSPMPDLTRQGADILADIDRTSAKKVRSIIAQGNLDGLSRDQIRQQVEDAFGGWADARARSVALHEVSTAFHDAIMAWARSVDADVDIYKEWLTDSDPCEICQGNADEGLVVIDDAFPSGQQVPPEHPNCRCSIRLLKGNPEE